MEARLFAVIALALVCAGLLLPLTSSSLAALEGASDSPSIMEAYAQLLDTHAATRLAPQGAIDALNLAIEKANLAAALEASDPARAQALMAEADQLAEGARQTLVQAKSQGLQEIQNGNIILGASVAVLAALAFLAYRFMPGFLWRSWLRLRGGYTVSGVVATPPKKEKKEDEDEAGEETTITMETVSAIVAIALVLIAAAAVAQPILAARGGEGFSELGVLGPNMTIGGYPTTVEAGSAISLYTYVGNHLGQPMWFRVLVKVGDNSSAVNPLDADPIFAEERVVADSANWTAPVSFALANIGVNQRVIFELWGYNLTSANFEYTGRWNQLWVNVTMPQ